MSEPVSLKGFTIFKRLAEHQAFRIMGTSRVLRIHDKHHSNLPYKELCSRICTILGHWEGHSMMWYPSNLLLTLRNTHFFFCQSCLVHLVTLCVCVSKFTCNVCFVFVCVNTSMCLSCTCLALVGACTKRSVN